MIVGYISQLELANLEESGACRITTKPAQDGVISYALVRDDVAGALLQREVDDVMRQLVQLAGTLGVELPDSSHARAHFGCTCGDPMIPNTVHRAKLPCYQAGADDVASYVAAIMKEIPAC